MRVQVLASVMNQSLDIVDKMNISSDAIIINQCSQFELQKLVKGERNISIYSFSERGVGLSRNNALIHASEDILLFADDDLVYNNTYETQIIREFEEHPDADMIFFNVPSLNCKRPSFMVKKFSRVHWFNCLRYGTIRIAVKRLSIHSRNITFSLLFGGGAYYGSGEDTLFIHECLKKGLKIYTSPEIIGYVEQKTSSWFRGYNEKYFYDKGALFYSISPLLFRLYCLQYCIRKYSIYSSDIKFGNAYRCMMAGSKDIKRKQMGKD